MGWFEDVINILRAVPLLRRLRHLPAEVDDLKARIAALEEKLGGKWPPDVCRCCGARSARLVHNWLNDGVACDVWDCQECKGRDLRYRSVRGS